MSISLSQSCKTDLNNASRQGVSNILSSLSTTLLSQNKWFNNDNIDENYSAASTITHLEDAWNYFGKAILSILNNDVYTSRHLAYYAELRACMSLLATEGIIIKNNKHYIVDNTGQLRRINEIYRTVRGVSKNTLGTHQMVWLVFEYWGTQQRSRNLLEDIIKIDSLTLKEWVDIYDDRSWAGLTDEIFRQLGIDLQLMAKDRDLRNKISYEPSELYEQYHTTSIVQNIEFILECWKLLEPNTNNGFQTLDIFMLKNIIHLLDKKVSRLSFKSKRRKKGKLVYEAYKNSNISRTFANELYNFLQACNHPVFTEASVNHNTTTDSLKDPRNHLQILSRALLLLRITTGSVHRLLRDANITMNDISFWRKKIIQNDGMLPTEEIDDFESYDLWTDINDFAIDVLANISNTFDCYQTQRDNSYPILLLSQGKRPLLWGIEY